MGFSETLMFYSLVGVAVAVAVSLQDRTVALWHHTVEILMAFLFWPLYLPALLRGAIAADHHVPGTSGTDEMSRAIERVDAELDAALTSLDGWAEDVLTRETVRIHELRDIWNAQAERIREMDRLLVRLEAGEPAGHIAVAATESEEALLLSERGRHSELARQKNVERLRNVRRVAYKELMDTLAWVRELVSMIHLAKYTGAPASRAEELVAQIAAAVEGVSAVTWRDAAAEQLVS